MTRQLKPPKLVTINSPEKGTHVAIIVGIHGNERGPQLEWEWLNNLKLKKGTLQLVFANPTASEMNVRFVNVNLNRRFGRNLHEWPEDSIARTIEKVLDDCDALLDLHMYNETMDRPFAICNATSNELAKVLPVSYIVNLPDDIDGGGTDDYMAARGKIGVCFETGSSERPTQYSEIIRKGVMSFLSSFGMVEHGKPENREAKVLVKDSTKLVESADLAFSKYYSSFDPIHKNEVICVENGKEFRAQKEGYILFPRPNNPVGTEAYYTLVQQA